jgi:lipoprotein signal peptidase
VGILALIAWRVRSWRGKWLWIVTIVAEAMMMLQVVVGVVLVASDDYVAPRFHMFYGFLAFLTVGIAYSYRQQMRGRRELFYGLVGLFIMGLGIRAILQAT